MPDDLIPGAEHGDQRGPVDIGQMGMKGLADAGGHRSLLRVRHVVDAALLFAQQNEPFSPLRHMHELVKITELAVRYQEKHLQSIQTALEPVEAESLQRKMSFQKFINGEHRTGQVETAGHTLNSLTEKCVLVLTCVVHTIFFHATIDSDIAKYDNFSKYFEISQMGSLSGTATFSCGASFHAYRHLFFLVWFMYSRDIHDASV